MDERMRGEGDAHEAESLRHALEEMQSFLTPKSEGEDLQKRLGITEEVKATFLKNALYSLKIKDFRKALRLFSCLYFLEPRNSSYLFGYGLSAFYCRRYRIAYILISNAQRYGAESSATSFYKMLTLVNLKKWTSARVAYEDFMESTSKETPQTLIDQANVFFDFIKEHEEKT